jgi:hypothetical protein
MEDRTPEINKTRIIFNSKFKEFINKLKVENSAILNQTKTLNYNIVEEIQEEIRKWIIENQSYLTFCWNNQKIDKSPYSMPDFFVIFISLLVDLDKCYNWEDIYTEFKNMRDNKIIIDFTIDASDNLLEDDETLRTSSCLCSHKCLFKNMAFISNNISEIKLWIACDCCEKTGIMTKSEFQKRVREARPKIMKAYQEKKTIEKKKRKESELEKIYRRCNNCDELKVLHIEPSWKKLCGRCYFEKKHKEEIEICLLKK